MKTISLWMPIEDAVDLAPYGTRSSPTNEGYIIIDSWAGGISGRWCYTLKVPDDDAVMLALKYQVIGERGSEFNNQLQS